MRNVHNSAPIVVVLGGGNESLAALDWAIEQARDGDYRLRVITGFRRGGFWDEAASVEPNSVAAQARRRLAASGVAYDHVVALGAIEYVLADYSHDAVYAVVAQPSRLAKGRVRRSLTKLLAGPLACPIITVNADHQPTFDAHRPELVAAG